MKKPSVRVAVVALMASGSALATPPPPSPGPGGSSSGTARAQASERAPACTRGEASALAEIACELGRQLEALPSGAVVVSAPVAADVELTDARGLSTRLARVVAGHLAARAVDEPAKLDRARALAGDATSLVHLEPRIAAGELRVGAGVLAVRRGFWERVRRPKPAPTRHAFASRRLDAEIQTFLPVVPLVAGAVVRATSPERDALALACDDLDGDGALEIVLVARRRIHVGRLRAGAFTPHATAAWTDLSPVSPRPLREPLGAVAVTPGRHLDVGISDREKGVRLGPALERLSDNSAKLPWPGGGCSRILGLAVDGVIGRCAASDGDDVLGRFPSATDAVGARRIVARDGSAALVRVGRVVGEDVALVEDGTGRRGRLPGVGAQLAVGDLDRDGAPEIVTSSSTLDPRADAVVVHTWRTDGALVERFRVAVPTGVRALAVCPPDGPALAPLAIATTDGVWVLR